MLIRSLFVRSWLPLLVALLAGCSSVPERTPTLDDLAAATDAEKAGEWLMERSHHLTRLDEPARTDAVQVIAVHGYGSEGTEWVGPLVRLGQSGARVTFYRWDWKTCPDSAADALRAALDQAAAAPGVKKLRIIGHSYGGLITALAARRYRGKVPWEVHVIAAPLAGMPKMQTLCGPVPVGDEPPAGRPVTLRQWRTVHSADGAFRDLESDPQVADWAGDDIVQLPETWNGGRLGHNRSISYVTEQLVPAAAAAQPAAAEPPAPAAEPTAPAAEPTAPAAEPTAPAAEPTAPAAADPPAAATP